MTLISDRVNESITAKKMVLSQEEDILKAGKLIKKQLAAGYKLLICGNGGSAADAQHIAAEMVGRFQKERKGLPAIALTTDSSILTAWSNDYEFDTLFSRQVEALGAKGDILLGLSTSGNSKNVVHAVQSATKKDMHTIVLTGRDGGKLQSLANITINIAVNKTARVQEAHMLVYHILCEIAEESFTKE